LLAACSASHASTRADGIAMLRRGGRRTARAARGTGARPAVLLLLGTFYAVAAGASAVDQRLELLFERRALLLVLRQLRARLLEVALEGGHARAQVGGLFLCLFALARLDFERLGEC